MVSICVVNTMFSASRLSVLQHEGVGVNTLDHKTTFCPSNHIVSMVGDYESSLCHHTAFRVKTAPSGITLCA
jgi:hypothetical protein